MLRNLNSQLGSRHITPILLPRGTYACLMHEARTGPWMWDLTKKRISNVRCGLLKPNLCKRGTKIMSLNNEYEIYERPGSAKEDVQQQPILPTRVSQHELLCVSSIHRF